MANDAVTKRAIDALAVTGKQHFLWDATLPGFGVRVSPAGVKSYIYQYRLGGRDGGSRRTTIGRHGELTPDLARKLAHKLAEQVRGAIDPVDARRKAVTDKHRAKTVATELAFDAYVARYLDLRIKPEKPRSYAFVEGALRKYAIPLLKKKPLPDITKRDLVAVIDAIPADMPSVRRSVFAVLRKMLNWARERDDIVANPMDSMNVPRPVASRDRVLNDDELALALRAARKLEGGFGPFYQLAFATGARRGEIGGLDWSELDRHTALWTLPAARSKNNEASLMPLNRHALAALDALAKAQGGSEALGWPRAGAVFAQGGDQASKGYSRGKSRLDALMLKLAREDALLADNDPDAVTLSTWRLHDARRTLATGLQRLGVRFEVTEAVLNHTAGASRSGVAAVYQRHSWGPEKRAALDAWAEHCDRVLNPMADDANVVPLRREA